MVEVKRKYTSELLQKFYSDLFQARQCVTLHNFTETIIQYCLDVCILEISSYVGKESTDSRKFMEQNPNAALPSDYSKYPGKMDHATCVCIRVGSSTSPFAVVEQEIDNLTLAMKEPATGLRTRPFQGMLLQRGKD